MFILNKDSNNEGLFVVNDINEIDSHNFTGTLSLTKQTDVPAGIFVPTDCKYLIKAPHEIC